MGHRLTDLVPYIVHRRTRYVLSWLVAITLACVQYDFARQMYASRETNDAATNRPIPNFGHTLIDFGGQWLGAHMVAAGRGKEMFSRPAQREELSKWYPTSAEAAGAKEHDADALFRFMMTATSNGPDEPSIGGPLYPPTQAVLFSPLGAMPPPKAYHLGQILLLGMGFVSGLAISGISRHRIWWPVATTFVMIAPGFGPSIHLAQNSSLSLAIVLVGWWFASRDREIAAGAVWGLLTFKPVWAVAFLLVPLLTRRWRMLAAMIVTGIALVMATVPFVGLQSWLDWLRVGDAGASLYKVDENWVFLSRDLLGIPRRWLLNFGEPMETRDRLAAGIIGWSLWSVVVLTTAAVALSRREAVIQPVGYGAGFIALGAYASCFHFIYYDSLVCMFPLTLLLSDTRRFISPVLLVVSAGPSRWAGYFGPRPIGILPTPANMTAGAAAVAVLNSFVLTAFALLLVIEQSFSTLNIEAKVHVGMISPESTFPNPLRISTGQAGTPWDTFVLLGLWAYCGARLLMRIGETQPEPTFANKPIAELPAVVR
jgi:hypothetical protein